MLKECCWLLSKPRRVSMVAPECTGEEKTNNIGMSEGGIPIGKCMNSDEMLVLSSSKLTNAKEPL